jgi:hypothetical protein
MPGRVEAVAVQPTPTETRLQIRLLTREAVAVAGEAAGRRMAVN